MRKLQAPQPSPGAQPLGVVDVVAEHVVDQLRDIDPLGTGAGGQVPRTAQ